MNKKLIIGLSIAVILSLVGVGTAAAVANRDSSSVNSSSASLSSSSSSSSSTLSEASTSISSSSEVSSSSISSSVIPQTARLADLKGDYNMMSVSYYKDLGNGQELFGVTRSMIGSMPVSSIVIFEGNEVVFEREGAIQQYGIYPGSTKLIENINLFDETHLIYDVRQQSGQSSTHEVTLLDLQTLTEVIVSTGDLITFKRSGETSAYLADRSHVIVKAGVNAGLYTLDATGELVLQHDVDDTFTGIDTNTFINDQMNYPSSLFVFRLNDYNTSTFTSTKEMSLVYDLDTNEVTDSGERSLINYPYLGTSYTLNVYANMSSLTTTVVTADQYNQRVVDMTMKLMKPDGTVVVDKAVSEGLTYFKSNNANLLNGMPVLQVIDSVTLCDSNNTSTGWETGCSFYDASLEETNSFTIAQPNVRIDRLGNAIAYNTNSLTAYTPNGETVVYNKVNDVISASVSEGRNAGTYMTNFTTIMYVDLTWSGTSRAVYFDGTEFVTIPFEGTKQYSSFQFIGDYIVFRGVSSTDYVASSMNLAIHQISTGITSYITKDFTYMVTSYPNDTFGTTSASIQWVMNNSNMTVGALLLDIENATAEFVPFATPVPSQIWIESVTNVDGVLTLRQGSTLYGIDPDDLTAITTSTTNATSGYQRTYTDLYGTNDLTLVQSYGSTGISSQYYYGDATLGLENMTLLEVPTDFASAQVYVYDVEGTANDVIYLFNGRAVVNILSGNFETYTGFFTATGFTSLDEDFFETENALPISSTNIIFN